ncbi:hypothetical protein FH972_010175 [Carpinus fangiana]|uniref:Uncharacterized protein n=1 Tax=Carpinus fangiana TaxID=176857 RepID=A0A660KPF8_9ROSI|nr:hypothetical protein FH972_010175 [Carpinus fangiana]
MGCVTMPKKRENERLSVLHAGYKLCQLSDGMQSTKNGSLTGRVEVGERADGRAGSHVLDDAGSECGRPQ